MTPAYLCCALFALWGALGLLLGMRYFSRTKLAVWTGAIGAWAILPLFAWDTLFEICEERQGEAALAGAAALSALAWMTLRAASKKGPRAQITATNQARSYPSSDNQGKRIGVLIVAYNALTTLSKVLNRIPPEVWTMIEEVAVFDDASADETYELAVGHKAIFGREKLTIFRNDENLGYGGNQKRGYQYFISKGFDIVIMLHGDGQYAPEILAHLYAPLVAGEAEAVFGSRMMPDYGGPLRGGMPLYKFVGNKILTWFSNRALGMSLTEFHSGYRAYSLHALKEINMQHMTDVFHFDTQIIIKLRHQGFRIKEVPIPTYYGNEICYVNGMKYAKDVFKAILRYQRTARGLTRAPEYSEYYVHYALKESRYSSHYFMQMLAGRDADILEIGCGEGFMTALLAGQGNRVVGIDVLDKPLHHGHMADYCRADLDAGMQDVASSLGNRLFDRILLPDILEHLRRPEQVLRDCHAYLKNHGQIVVSLPNVANITVRAALLCGRFEYAERGILDRTHLRFFTRASARRLLEEAGYEVLRTEVTVMPLELVLGLSPHNPIMASLTWTLRLVTRLFPGLLGYQTVLVARPKAKAEAVKEHRAEATQLVMREAAA